MSANRKPKSPLELLGGFFCAWIMVGRVGLEPKTPGLKVWYRPVHQRPKFQAEFHVPEEELDGPFQGLVKRYRQSLGHYGAAVQHP